MPIICDPFLFQRALFCSWELAMDEAGPSPEFEMVIKPEDDEVVILISSDRGGDGLRSRREWKELSGMIGRLRGRVHCERSDTGFTLSLDLPAHPKADA